MASWLEFQASAPEIAERGRGLLFRTGTGEGLLSTLAGEGLPRTHPVNIGIVDGRLMTFVQSGSSKARDLAVDGRYALHAHQDPAVPHEFLLRGRGVEVTDAETRARAVESWPFEAEDEVHARRAWHRPGPIWRARRPGRVAAALCVVAGNHRRDPLSSRLPARCAP